MRLNDFRREAERFSVIDKAALEEAERQLAALPYKAARKIGRCANGAERGKGYVYHALESGRWVALCGAKPGRQSAGWQSEPEPLDRLNCPRCLKKLSAVIAAPMRQSDSERQPGGNR